MLFRSVGNTPFAIRESGLGKTWDPDDGHWFYYSMDVEDKQIEQDLKQYSLDDESRLRSGQHHIRQRSTRRQRQRRSVKDKEFYALLKVPTDASQSEIKRAYYREALLTHPDKNVDGNAMQANQRFQQLSLAYRTLSNDDAREAYDQMGKCFVEPDHQQQQLDIHTFFAVMFGSDLVEPYVGEFRMASLFDSFLRVTSTDRSHDDTEHHRRSASSFYTTNDDFDHASVLKQKRRALDIALHLRGRLAQYSAGIQSEAEFRASCQLEAVAIAKDGDFGDAFLISIGWSLMMEGKKYIGKHTSAFGLHGATTSIQATARDVLENYQTLVALVRSVASLVGPLTEALGADAKRQHERSMSDNSSRNHDNGGGGTNCENIHEAYVDTLLLIQMLERSLPRAVRLVWHLNDRDIRLTVKEAVDRLLRDGSSHDVCLARARGLVILGTEFNQIGMLEKRKGRWENTDALTTSMATAFEAATTSETHAGS